MSFFFGAEDNLLSCEWSEEKTGPCTLDVTLWAHDNPRRAAGLPWVVGEGGGAARVGLGLLLVPAEEVSVLPRRIGCWWWPLHHQRLWGYWRRHGKKCFVIWCMLEGSLFLPISAPCRTVNDVLMAFSPVSQNDRNRNVKHPWQG